jgi:hypothetical protein
LLLLITFTGALSLPEHGVNSMLSGLMLSCWLVVGWLLSCWLVVGYLGYERCSSLSWFSAYQPLHGQAKDMAKLFAYHHAARHTCNS